MRGGRFASLDATRDFHHGLLAVHRTVGALGVVCLVAAPLHSEAAAPLPSSALHHIVDAQAAQTPEVIVEVRVHGNHSIPDAEVIRIAGVTRGDPLRAGTISEIEARLRGSGRVDRVEVRKRYRSLTDTQDVVLILVVHEKPTSSSQNLVFRTAQVLAQKALFMPVLTYAEGYGFTYGVRASTIDLFGAGERISMPLTWGGTKRAAVEMGREFERGFLSRLQTGASISSRENPHFEVEERRVELRGRIDREIVKGVRLSAAARWTDVEFAEIRDRFVTYGLSLSVDTRRDPTFPRDAVFAHAGWEKLNVSDAGASAGRTRLEVRAYKGVIGQTVLSVRGLYEAADRSLPAYEQPFLGGGATVRGYSFGQFVGDNIAVGSAELRIPLTSPLDIGSAGVSVFFDTGAAYDVGQRLRKTRFHQGVGAGAFLVATVFQLKLDLAYGFDDGVRLHVATGFSF